MKVSKNKPIDLTTQDRTIVLALSELRDTRGVIVERWVSLDAMEYSC